MDPWRALVVGSVAVVLGAAACGATGTEDVGTVGADGPTGTSEPSKVQDPPASVDEGGSSTAEACAAAVALRVVEAPSIGFDEFPEPSSDETEALLDEVGAVLTGDVADGFARLRELTDRSYLDPEAVTAEEQAEGYGLLTSLTMQVAALCADHGPFWSCPAREQFTPVGESFAPVGEIGEGSNPAGPPDGPDPRALVDEIDQAGDVVVVVDEGDHLYAWVDESGTVVRSLEVVAVEGGWSRGTDTTCVDAGDLAESAEEKFDDVGEAIEESVPDGTVWSPDAAEWVVPYETLYRRPDAPYTYDHEGYFVGYDECYWYHDRGDEQLDRWCEEHIFSNP